MNESLDSSEEDFDDSDDEQQQGLTFQKIQQFEKFQADESFLDDQCAICMGDFEVGRNMMRLNCDGQHFFVKSALKNGLLPRRVVQFVVICFSNVFSHNACPNYRHHFSKISLLIVSFIKWCSNKTFINIHLVVCSLLRFSYF